MRVGMHLDGLAENSQCKISASLEACLRAHERKDSTVELGNKELIGRPENVP